MKTYRFNRLFNARSRNCFDGALDRGFFGEPAFLSGVENIERTIISNRTQAPMHHTPRGIMRALMLLVHDQSTPEAALQLIQETT